MSRAPVLNQSGAEVDSDSKVDTSRLNMRYLVKALVKYNASDLHLKSQRSPLYRINGKLVPAKMDELTDTQIFAILKTVMTPAQLKELEERRQVDLTFLIPELGRFRANVFYQRSQVSAVIRMIPFAVPSMIELGLPVVLKDLCQRSRGLLLVAGATGSGKSTTASALIQHINQTRHVHVISIEDPIEFVYRDIKASITQREVGADALSFADAIHAALRQDPDILVIGEIRDRETIQAAITAAETGHLVISTIHTSDAKGTIDRILDVFPAEQQNQIRIQLAASLIGVVSQSLLVRADGKGRVPACEVMVKSPTIEQAILKNERDRIPDIISQSSSYYKMQTFNMALERLVMEGTVTADEAIKASNNPEELQLKFSGITRDEGYHQTSAWKDPGQDEQESPKEVDISGLRLARRR